MNNTSECRSVGSETPSTLWLRSIPQSRRPMIVVALVGKAGIRPTMGQLPHEEFH
jgi:hypothetical protein